MVNTGWKKMMGKAGRSQRSTAQALSVNLAELSMVAQGRAFLTPEKFKLACELLQCRPTDLYARETLAFIYGGGENGKPERKKKAQIRIHEPQLSRLDDLAKRNKVTRTEAANAILWAHLFPEEWQEVMANARDALQDHA